MDQSELKLTKLDQSRPKWTKLDRIGFNRPKWTKWIEMDQIIPKQTEVEKNELNVKP